MFYSEVSRNGRSLKLTYINYSHKLQNTNNRIQKSFLILMNDKILGKWAQLFKLSTIDNFIFSSQKFPNCCFSTYHVILLMHFESKNIKANKKKSEIFEYETS